MQNEANSLNGDVDPRNPNINSPPMEAYERHETPLVEQKSTDFGAAFTESTAPTQDDLVKAGEGDDLPPEYDPQDHGVRRIIRNFTPS